MRRLVRILICLQAAICGCGTGPVLPLAQTTVNEGPPAQKNLAVHSERTVGVDASRRNLQPDDWFEDVTKRTGINFSYRNGREAGRFYLIESFGGGVGMVDFDLDGDLDLFFTGGGTISAERPDQIGGLPSGLFRNDGDFRFVDVTDPAGFGVP